MPKNDGSLSSRSWRASIARQRKCAFDKAVVCSQTTPEDALTRVQELVAEAIEAGADGVVVARLEDSDTTVGSVDDLAMWVGHGEDSRPGLADFTGTARSVYVWTVSRCYMCQLCRSPDHPTYVFLRVVPKRDDIPTKALLHAFVLTEDAVADTAKTSRIEAEQLEAYLSEAISIARAVDANDAPIVLIVHQEHVAGDNMVALLAELSARDTRADDLLGSARLAFEWLEAQGHLPFLTVAGASNAAPGTCYLRIDIDGGKPSPEPSP